MKKKKTDNSSVKFAMINAMGAALFLCGIFFPAQFDAAGEPSVPVITVSPDVYYPPDEILYIEGRSLSDAVIQLQFQKSGVKSVIVNTKTDANGEWVFAEKIPLNAGDWEVRARSADSSGVVSVWSNPRVFKAVATGIALGAGVTLQYSLLLFAFLVILASCIVFVIYASSRMHRFQARAQSLRVQKLEQELREKNEKLRDLTLEKGKEAAEAAVEKSFVELQGSIMQELKHMETLAGTRSLSLEEVEHRERLRADLARTAERIELQIKNIEHGS